MNVTDKNCIICGINPPTKGTEFCDDCELSRQELSNGKGEDDE